MIYKVNNILKKIKMNVLILITIILMIFIVGGYLAYIFIEYDKTSIVVTKENKHEVFKKVIDDSKKTENILDKVEKPIIESDSVEIYQSDEM